MSIIAEALKKAQRKSKSGGEVPPPFKLGQNQETAPPAPAGQAPKAIPVVVQPGTAAPKAQPVPKAKPVSSPQPAAKEPQQPKPSPAAQPAKTKTAGKQPLFKQRKVRIVLMVGTFLIVSAGAVYYVNNVYLPGLQQGGITTAAPPPQAIPPAATQESVTPATSGENTAATGETQTEGAGAQAVESSETPADAENLDVPPVPEIESVPGGESGDGAGSDVAYLPDLVPDGQASGISDILALGGELSGVGVPSAPPAHETPGSIVHKGEQGKELREDIYHFNMAVYFQRKGDVREALREYAEVIRLSPHNAEVFCNMGALYNQVGEYEEAVSVLQKALLIDPRYSKARNNLAVAYYRIGQYNPALEQAKMAVELQPGNLDALSNMGLIYRKLENNELAEQSFNSALAVDPGYAAAHYNLALLYEQTGQLTLAARHYRSFLSGGGGADQLNDKVRSRLQQLSTTTVAPGN